MLLAGRLLLWLGPRGRQLLCFSTDAEDRANRRLAFGALHRLGRWGRRGRLVIEQINGRPALESGLRTELLEAGFESDGRGLARLPAANKRHQLA